MPVHPALAKALAHWRLSGFAALYGRPPDDFIVPDPSTMGARTRSRAGKDHRADVEALGMYQRGRLTHGLRRWFISACRNAPARREVIEEAFKVDAKDRALVVAELSSSEGIASPEEVEAAWREEIARRVKSLEAGTAVLHDWDEVNEEISSILKRA